MDTVLAGNYSQAQAGNGFVRNQNQRNVEAAERTQSNAAEANLATQQVTAAPAAQAIEPVEPASFNEVSNNTQEDNPRANVLKFQQAAEAFAAIEQFTAEAGGDSGGSSSGGLSISV